MGVGGPDIGFQRLANHDEHALAHVGHRRGQGDAIRGLDVSFGHLDQGGTMSERKEIAVVDDAYIVIAALSRDVAPSDEIERRGGPAEDLARLRGGFTLEREGRPDEGVVVIEHPRRPAAVGTQPAAERR
jgi:hypothetical protein